jgi:predicted amidohydrolase
LKPVKKVELVVFPEVFISGPHEAEEGILYVEIIAVKRMFDVVGHYSRPDVLIF